MGTMGVMSGTRSSMGSDDAPSWAAESLPMSVRKELLERELSKLGFRKPESHGGTMQHQQQSSSHPNADADSGEHGGG